MHNPLNRIKLSGKRATNFSGYDCISYACLPMQHVHVCLCESFLVSSLMTINAVWRSDYLHVIHRNFSIMCVISNKLFPNHKEFTILSTLCPKTEVVSLTRSFPLRMGASKSDAKTWRAVYWQWKPIKARLLKVLTFDQTEGIALRVAFRHYLFHSALPSSSSLRGSTSSYWQRFSTRSVCGHLEGQRETACEGLTWWSDVDRIMKQFVKWWKKRIIIGPLDR